MKVKLTICYDGTDFCGWQVQPEGRTVQGVIEDAIYTLTNKRVRVTGSGRTDAGVHAKGQVAHVKLDTTIPPEKLYKALNIILPADVKILNSEIVEDNFDACRKAKKKTYRYTMYKGEVEHPLYERYAVKIYPNVDIKKMQDACKCFIGEKDFVSISASGNSTLSTVRTIYDLKVDTDGDFVYITVTGNGFLYNMVRIMAGVLLSAGEGKITTKEIDKIIESKDRTLFPKTLPSKGLCLMKVEY